VTKIGSVAAINLPHHSVGSSKAPICTNMSTPNCYSALSDHQYLLSHQRRKHIHSRSTLTSQHAFKSTSNPYSPHNHSTLPKKNPPTQPCISPLQPSPSSPRSQLHSPSPNAIQAAPPPPAPEPNLVAFTPGASNKCIFANGYGTCSKDQTLHLVCTDGEWKSTDCGVDVGQGGWKKMCGIYINTKDPNSCKDGYVGGWYATCTDYEDMSVPEPNVSSHVRSPTAVGSTSSIHPTSTKKA